MYCFAAWHNKQYEYISEKLMNPRSLYKIYYIVYAYGPTPKPLYEDDNGVKNNTLHIVVPTSSLPHYNLKTKPSQVTISALYSE